MKNNFTRFPDTDMRACFNGTTWSLAVNMQQLPLGILHLKLGDGKEAQRKGHQSRNAGRMMLIDLEPELRAMDQARFTTGGVHFDNLEGQAWVNRVFQERLDELDVELFDTGVLRSEETANELVETRVVLVPAVPQVPQSFSEPGRKTDILDRLGEAPVGRTIHPRRRLGPVNSTTDTKSGTSRSETTSTSREERRPDRCSLMWSRPIPSHWHVYKQDLMKLNLQMVKFAVDVLRMLNGARLSVNELYSIVGVDWLVEAGIKFSSTMALRFGTALK